jgi:competence protein ComEA
MLDRLHGRRRQVVAAAALAVVALLAGRLLASAGAPAERPLVRPPVQVASAPASLGAPAAPAVGAALVVDVVGAVRRPGLYRLPQGSRVADAVARAGGATHRADTSLVNLAAPLSDGVQIVVPRRGGATPGLGAGPASGGVAGGPVHLNSASAADLDALPGVGPVTAQKIIDYRQQHGPYTALDDLDAIPGIGAARIEQLRGLAEP